MCGKRYGYTAVFLDTSVPGGNLHRVRELSGRTSYRPFRPKLVVVPTERRVEEVVVAVNRIRPDVLRGTGAYVEALFRTLGSPRPGMHRPAVVTYSWDAMTTEGRQFVEEVFGIPVLSRYSSMESLKIGFFCEERAGFHLHEDLCHVELVGADGAPVPSGEAGEVVVSNLVNRGTVLLRYRLGDVARLALEPCACGRTSQRLVDLEGRLSEVIRLPDGTLVHSRGVGSVVNQLAGVIRFQLVQRGPKSFELRLQTIDRPGFDLAAPQAVAGLRTLLPGCVVEAVYEEIPLSPGEKHRSVVLL
jgi:phenylacetate-CoA ligase